VITHPDAEAELGTLPRAEVAAVDNAIRKLEELGPALGFPHTSNVQGADRIHELRPRAGRCPWRAFYRRVGERYIVTAIGAEAQADRRGFRKAVAAAEDRAAEWEDRG
jgi:hypothetical protein